VTPSTNPGTPRAGQRRKTRPQATKPAYRQPSKNQAHTTGRTRLRTAIGGWPSRRKRLVGAFAAIATVLGVLSSGTALFDWFGSKLNPSAPSPAKIDARLTPPTLLDVHKPLGGYLSDTNQSATGLTPFQLAEPGFEFLIRIHLQGNQGRTIRLHWSVIDVSTGNPLPGATYNQDAAAVRARGADQERQWPIWVPSPPSRGRFVLRATLLDEKRRPLDEADSKPFTVATAPGP
jgi:hypothetical protein